MSTRVNPKLQSDESASLEWKLKSKVVGQDRAVHSIVKTLERFSVGLQAPHRPLATFIFMGGTGVGKTEVVHALAEALLGNRDAVTRINCSEYQESHEIAKLIGAPPGYLGFRESESARFQQKQLDQFRNQDGDPNIILLDEIEKSHDAMFRLLLGVLDDGRVTLGDGTTTNFDHSIIIMTSNLGSKETQQAIHNTSLGFQASGDSREGLDQRIYEISKTAATRFFKPEFLNRVDKIVSFRSLSEDSLHKILRLEINKVQSRLCSSPHVIMFRVTPEAEKFLLREGTSEAYGGREIKRSVERFITDPLASLIASKQITEQDSVTVGYEGGKELVFDKIHDPLTVIKREVPVETESGSQILRVKIQRKIV